MKREKKCFVILATLCYFLAACVPAENVSTKCIPPLTDFAYFAGQGSPYPEQPVAPPGPWIADITIDLKSPVLLGVRLLPNNTKEFWIWDWETSRLSQAESNELTQGMFVFRTDGTGLNPVLLDKTLTRFALPVKKIFIAPDNSVWVVHQTSENVHVPILGRYDEAQGQIIPVATLGKIKSYSFYQATVLMDEKTSLFWVLVPYDHIYSYDPDSDTLVQHIAITDINPTSATITPDGKIYIYSHKHEYSKYETADALFLYSPQKESIVNIPVGLELDFQRKNLFIDNSGRLWLGSFGWKESTDKWYQTLRPAIFVLSEAEPGFGRIHHWVSPDIKFESPDNTLWFSGAGGIYSLDFNQGKWCWVSTSTNLEQDTNGNLWILFSNQFFRLSPK